VTFELAVAMLGSLGGIPTGPTKMTTAGALGADEGLVALIGRVPSAAAIEAESLGTLSGPVIVLFAGRVCLALC
jgi:hypothetical protein